MSRTYEQDQDKMIKNMLNKKIVDFNANNKNATKDAIKIKPSNSDKIVLTKDEYILVLERLTDKLVTICEAQSQLLDIFETMMEEDE